MAYTTEQYNALCAAIATGTLEVWYSDKKVVYRTLAEMLTIRRQMEIELKIKKVPPRKVTAIYNKFGNNRG